MTEKNLIKVYNGNLLLIITWVILTMNKIIETSLFKKFMVALLLGTVMTGYLTTYCQTVHNHIADNVVRLHVVANSDSTFDQQLKLKVKDNVVKFLSTVMDDANSVDEAKVIINKNIDKITEIAKQTVGDVGYNVESKTGVFSFPTKQYGTSKLPRGDYYGLKVVIGEGQGKNWWCVLYPQLCFSEFGEESKKKLKNTLDEEEYNLVTDSDNYKFKFKLLELLGE